MCSLYQNCGESNTDKEMAEGIFPDVSHSKKKKNDHNCLSEGKEITIVKKHLKYIHLENM